MRGMSDIYKNHTPKRQEKINMAFIGEHGRITISDRELRSLKDEPVGKKEKICLNCNASFYTLGNRICQSCKRLMENSFLDKRKAH